MRRGCRCQRWWWRLACGCSATTISAWLASRRCLLLLPVGLCIYLVWRCLPRSGGRRLWLALLLLAPFAMTAFLADVTNILVDEGYLYSFLAVAVALLFFDVQVRLAMSEWSRAMLFAVAVDGVYLSKSGALPVVTVLTANLSRGGAAGRVALAGCGAGCCGSVGVGDASASCQRAVQHGHQFRRYQSA